MASAKISEQNEAGQLTVRTKLPQSTNEQTAALLPVELLPEDLVQVEAQDPLAEFDRDEPPTQHKPHPVFMFLSYFWGPIPWLIESSAVLSAVARRWEVSGIILILLLVDAYLGFWQEYQAGNIIATLKGY
jgi:magnesium-transporting ATPase (P-type)